MNFMLYNLSYSYKKGYMSLVCPFKNGLFSDSERVIH